MYSEQVQQNTNVAVKPTSKKHRHKTRVEKDEDIKNEFIKQWNANVPVKVMKYNFGISSNTLVKWRKKLGLPARENKYMGKENTLKVVHFFAPQTDVELMDINSVNHGLTRSGYLRKLVHDDIKRQQDLNHR